VELSPREASVGRSRAHEDFPAMTLLDAPKFNETAAKRNRMIGRGVLIAFGVVLVAYIILWQAVFHTFEFWAWPSEVRLNTFLKTVEGGDFDSAYAQWNHDPDWKQHPDKYKAYDINQFTKDWGPMSDYGKIRSHQIALTKAYGNGVVIGVYINGGKTPLFLRVDSKTKEIGFSPVELYVGP
jgi:hypothetical protein